jgi:hypothetical protein
MSEFNRSIAPVYKSLGTDIVELDQLEMMRTSYPNIIKTMSDYLPGGSNRHDPAFSTLK